MRVKIQTYITNEDGVYEPGATVDIRDALAHLYITNQWAIDPSGKVYRAADGSLKFVSTAGEKEVEADDTIETAALEGAPEVAVGRRQRGRPRSTSLG